MLVFVKISLFISLGWKLYYFMEEIIIMSKLEYWILHVANFLRDPLNEICKWKLTIKLKLHKSLLHLVYILYISYTSRIHLSVQSSLNQSWNCTNHLIIHLGMIVCLQFVILRMISTALCQIIAYQKHSYATAWIIVAMDPMRPCVQFYRQVIGYL